MTTWFVSRHAGAVEWLHTLGIRADIVAPSLDPALVSRSDVVVGNLPVHIAGEVCARGARFFHLAMDVPPAGRGVEFTARNMERQNARLEEYRIEHVHGEPAPWDKKHT